MTPRIYQWSSLLYLLKKLESTFNVYDIFLDINMVLYFIHLFHVFFLILFQAVGSITLPVCKRDGLKLLVHLGALLKYRFDGTSENFCNVDFHMLAAIKCFDFKLLISIIQLPNKILLFSNFFFLCSFFFCNPGNNAAWLPIYKLVEAAIGPKYVFHFIIWLSFN